MAAVVVDRLHATYDRADRTTADHLDAALAEVTRHGLAEHLLDRDLGDAFAVCIQRVHIDVDLDPSRSVDDLTRMWSAAVAAAVESSVAEAVVFRREEDAIDDLVTAVGQRTNDRLWALVQIGLVASGVTSASAYDLATALAERPALVPGAIARCRPRRLPLDLGGWIAVAGGFDRWSPRRRWCASTLGASTAPAITSHLHEDAAGGLAHRAHDAVPDHVWASVEDRERPRLAALALAAVAPAATPTPALLAVVADLTPPGGLTPPGDRPDHGAASRPRPPASAAGSPDHASADRPDVDGARTPRLAPTPEVEEAGAASEEGQEPIRTALGGVFFLAHCLDALDIVDRISHRPDDPDLVAVALAHIVADTTGVPVDDPAVLTLVGLLVDPRPPHVVSRLLADRRDDARAAADGLADDLIGCLTERLDATPADRAWIWARHAVISAAPGWIEATFRLDEVDVRVRAAGLDLDPGHLWWLGAVVRFRYV